MNPGPMPAVTLRAGDVIQVDEDGPVLTIATDPKRVGNGPLYDFLTEDGEPFRLGASRKVIVHELSPRGRK